MQIQTSKTSVLPSSSSLPPVSKSPSSPVQSAVPIISSSVLSGPDQMQIQQPCTGKSCQSSTGVKSPTPCNKTSTLTKVVGGVGLIGGGALAGFLVGGPIGAVIGALIGAILMALTVFGKNLGSLFTADKSKSTLPESPCNAKKTQIPAVQTPLIEKSVKTDKFQMPGQKEREERRIKYI